MIVLTFQVATAILAMAFGVLALRVARRVTAGEPLHHRAWLVTGVAFAVAGASSIVQNAAAVWAFRAGSGSIPWNLFLEWAPGGNYGRVCLKIAFGVVLALLTRMAGMPARRVAATAAAVFLAMLVVGGVLGALEGPWKEVIHYPMYAMLQSLELIVILVALFVGLFAGSMDRWLWAALALYGFRQALTVLSLTALAWNGVPGAWALSPSVNHLLGIAGYLVMIAVALHRLRLARRGVRVPGMFDAPRAAISTFD